MADLYNLDAELEVQHEIDDIAEDVEWQAAEDDDGGDVDDDEALVPAALLDAAAARRKGGGPEAEGAASKGDREYDGDLLGTDASDSAEMLRKIAYTRLYNAWSQECRAPELLPFLDAETFARLRECLQQQAERDGGDENNGAEKAAAKRGIDTGNANMDALFASVLRVDAERVKFLLADWHKLRLQKLEAHPLHMRTQTERMSAHEVDFLRNYGAAVERHFQTTVTDHFSQDVWKTLDAPDMVDEPDLDQFFFFRCLQDISFGVDVEDGGTDKPSGSQRHTAGTCLIVRYKRVRDLFQQGSIEFM